jgi:hypothetical protein
MPKGGWTSKGLGGGDTGGQGDKSRVAGLVAGKKCLVAEAYHWWSGPFPPEPLSLAHQRD